MKELSQGYDFREGMYEAARPMAADYPIFGTGPGTFGTVFQLYRFSNQTYWPEQLHNDWMETRITFGWIGMGLILAALACALLRVFAPGGIRGGRRFLVLSWLALIGCMIQARFDFPFQIHSILFLFLLVCTILFTMGRRPTASGQ
jgi:O-antigen ligase